MEYLREVESRSEKPLREGGDALRAESSNFRTRETTA